MESVLGKNIPESFKERSEIMRQFRTYSLKGQSFLVVLLHFSLLQKKQIMLFSKDLIFRCMVFFIILRIQMYDT